MSEIRHVVHASVSFYSIHGHNSRDRWEEATCQVNFPAVESTVRWLVGLETFCGSPGSDYQPAHRRFYEAAQKQRKIFILIVTMRTRTDWMGIFNCLLNQSTRNNLLIYKQHCWLIIYWVTIVTIFDHQLNQSPLICHSHKLPRNLPVVKSTINRRTYWRSLPGQSSKLQMQIRLRMRMPRSWLRRNLFSWYDAGSHKGT